MAPTDTSSLAGKTALITGGSRGIGEAIAIQFAKKGITGVAVTYANSASAAEGVLAKLRELGVKKTLAIHADLLDPEIGSNVIPKVLEGLETKTLDIVVNNAAVVDFTLMEPFELITLKNFSKGMQGMVFGMISIIQATLPYLPPRGGRIINISSITSKQANPDPMMVYGATKAAVDSLTRSLAVAYGVKTGATFNSLNVGATATEAFNKASDLMGPVLQEMEIARFSAEKRMGLPEDIAFIAGFLASEEGRWINGASVAANGGNRELIGLQG